MPAKKPAPKKKRTTKAPRKPKERGLCPRRQAFCREYLVDLNGAQAAIRAGYAARAARATASELLTFPDVQAEIRRQMDARAARVECNADTVLRELLRLATVDIGDAFDEFGRLRPIQDIPEDVRRALAGIDSYEEFAGRGEDRERVGETKKIRLVDKIRALELLGKHLGMFRDRIEHSGPGGGPIQTEASMTDDERESVRAWVAGIRKSILGGAK